MSSGSNWNGKLSQNLETFIAKGRRNSAVIISHLRSGSLPIPSWGGASTSKPSKKKTAFVMDVENPENGHKIGDDNPESNPFLEDSIRPELENKLQMVPMNRLTHEELAHDPRFWKRQGNNNLGLVLSAMYAKLLVVMGIAFPLSEVISTFIPALFYDGFYLYLYFGSIIFMICILGNVIREKATKSARDIVQGVSSIKMRFNANTSKNGSPRNNSANSAEDPDAMTTDNVSSESSDGFSDSPPPTPISRTSESSRIKTNRKISATILSASKERDRGSHFGSFYLRMGAVAFGIGSMIYSGLEFGQYFELEPDTKCHNIMMALTPAVRMIFTFMQMYFIFLNSKMAVSRGTLGSQFGLMHMIGTNLCVWLNVLVQETRHEILHFYDPDNQTVSLHHGKNQENLAHLFIHNSMESSEHHNTSTSSDGFHSNTDHLLQESFLRLVDNVTEIVHSRTTRGIKGPYSMYECRRTDIIGSIVQNAAPFLFPCTVEYSLICAAICYVMWKSMAKRRAARITQKMKRHHHGTESHDISGVSRSPHHYTVDCARANKGLFLGIFVLVMTIMSLIINFVLASRPNYKALGNLEVNITEVVVYTVSTVAVIIGMFQMRELRYAKRRNLELDNILLIVAQTGSLIFNVFTLISVQFIIRDGEKLGLFTALAKLIQLLLQTLFILDASKRVASTPEQAKRKPGREVVTFLLITNLAMWLINALEKSHSDSHPIQLQFYGVWAWTIITDISMPLAIFYRFHSTVCLCEIWKKAFKQKRISH